MEIKLDLLDMSERYSNYGWSKGAICDKWGISVKTLTSIHSYKPLSEGGFRIALNAITAEEKVAVRRYALAHTELNHREMAYRMIDEDIAFMSPSSVYRILIDNNLIAERLRRPKPSEWDGHQKPGKADEIWQTDLMVIRYKQRDYFLLSYIDVYSRFITYHKLCLAMTGDSIKEATQECLSLCDRWPENIQSDNGSGYISNEYRSYLFKADIQHRRIHPYCPNENAEIERYHRTLRELVDPQDAEDFDQLTQLIKEQIQYYNYTRYHSAIGFVTPYAKYCGQAEKILAERERKLKTAKEKRIRENLKKIKVKAA